MINEGVSYCRVSDVKFLNLPYFPEDNGALVVMEAYTHVPFKIERVFVAQAPAGAVRGQHAHKACTQFLTCPVGSIEVICDDGVSHATFILDRPDIGLLLPPSIWAQETYHGTGSVLVVLCDRPYESDDYIRDYGEFKIYRNIDSDLEAERVKL